MRKKNSKVVKKSEANTIKPMKISKTKWHDFKLGVLAVNCSSFLVAKLFLIFCTKQGISVDTSNEGGLANGWLSFGDSIGFVYNPETKRINCNAIEKYRKETYEVYKIG